MKTLKEVRTVAASLAVLAGVALSSSSAMAFDNVEWNWQKDVREKMDVDVYVDVDVESTGIVQLEKLQIFLGDAEASSHVSNIDNDPIRPKDWKCGGWSRGHSVMRSLDARTELPIVLSSASAIGNNQSITSDTPIMLHDGQFVANVKDHRYGCDQGCDHGFDVAAFGASMPASTPYNGGGGYGPEGNLHTSIAGLFTFGAAIGALTKAEIEAESFVSHVRNVSVDSSATAVANNLSVTLASDVDGGSACGYRCGDRLSNHVLVGDITQFALANVEAKSNVTNVTAYGYDNMRQLTTATLSPTEGNPGSTIQVPTPWVSSVATAVGNNVSINVGRDLRP
jgi:hypothetical protein